MHDTWFKYFIKGKIFEVCTPPPKKNDQGLLTMGRTINKVDGKTVKRMNVCNILFDDKFKAFIKKMKEEFLELLKQSINCSDYTILNDCKFKYECELCKSNMVTNVYNICYKCKFPTSPFRLFVGK